MMLIMMILVMMMIMTMTMKMMMMLAIIMMMVMTMVVDMMIETPQTASVKIFLPGVTFSRFNTRKDIFHFYCRGEFLGVCQFFQV